MSDKNQNQKKIQILQSLLKMTVQALRYQMYDILDQIKYLLDFMTFSESQKNVADLELLDFRAAINPNIAAIIA